MSEMDIFNLSADAFIQPEKKKGGEIYSPAADKGRDGVYSAVVRFVPFINDVSKSKISKMYAWLTNPDTGEGFSVDSPRTIGKKCIINDTFWKLKKSANMREQEKAEQVNTMTTYYSLVQIVKDQNQPELEGKIMVFKYGTKINEKIESLLKPSMGAAINPFDLFDGKLFELKITKKQKWNNYDACGFIGEKCAITIDGETMSKSKEDMEKIRQYLKDNSPDLTKYDFKEWTPEQEVMIHKIIKNILPDSSLPETVVTASTNQVSSGVSSVSSESYEEQEAPAPKASKATSKPATSIDDLYADL